MFRTLSLALLALGAASRVSAAVKTCNVLDYGAKADNSTDLGPALLAAWNKCVIPSSTHVATDTQLVVPAGNFLLRSNAVFDHAAYWNLRILGNIYLPYDPSLGGTMIEFDHCTNIVLSGNGAIYGNGYRYRPGGNLSLHPGRPRLIRFQSCDNCVITGVTLYDAPKFHVTIIGNNNVAHNMAIHATNIGETDGFDMSGNNNYVHDVVVENGDECVTVKTPTNGFVAENLVCINGAGSNIGSFGAGNKAVAVQNVVYRNVSVSNSDAGIMIKYFPDNSGYVRNITYNDFRFKAAAYPLYISAFWQGNGKDTGNLQISDVTYNNIVGTGTPTRPRVLLDCNAASPCKNIKFNGISVTNTVADKITHACGSGITGIPKC
ncbi:unnamed protein product [Mycena citricolor]|uniref:Glycoside hydrolase family 28 protein n=1 Tax=Mycena citricolor TaxID=2018698 RepID=A0AAD2GYZ1_9AGAR|nr:unnamed protein product [Mycena citricolor]